MSFGSRLRERREALKMNQSELGQLLGVTGSAIGNYENGFSFPKADVLYLVFDALHCDANFLFQDEMTETNEQDHTINERITHEEKQLLTCYRAMNGNGKEMLLNTARAFAGNPEMKEGSIQKKEIY